MHTGTRDFLGWQYAIKHGHSGCMQSSMVSAVKHAVKHGFCPFVRLARTSPVSVSLCVCVSQITTLALLQTHGLAGLYSHTALRFFVMRQDPSWLWQRVPVCLGLSM